ncbi:Chaperone protein dnaJ 20, chloroplastic, partial [Mucuna pruriens]
MYVVALSSSVSKPFNLVAVSKKEQRGPGTVFAVSCGGTKQQRVRGVEDNLYKILSLSPDSATTEDIKKAYRSMALLYHPDVCHNKEESTRMFVQLNAAYRTLSNPRLRAEYDCQLLGLRSQNKCVFADETWKRRWQDQVAELKIRSCTRVRSSWASRIRAKNIN